MHGTAERRQLIVERMEGLLADERKAQRTLWWYHAFSNVAVICGIVVPILAGSTVLASYQGLGGAWPLLSGALTLGASVLVALHKGLGCEAFHTKCDAALAELRDLAQAYERELNVPAGPPAAFEDLEARLADFHRSFADVLPMRPTRLLMQPKPGS